MFSGACPYSRSCPSGEIWSYGGAKTADRPRARRTRGENRIERNGRNSMGGDCSRAGEPAALHWSRLISLSRAIEDFERYVADERRYSPRTVRAYRTDLDRFAGFWESEF